MELKSINKNITFVYQNLANALIPTNDIQDIFSVVFADSVNQPITFTAPEVTNVFLPGEEIGISLTGKLAIFFDQKISEIDQERADKLAKLAYSIQEKMTENSVNNELLAYGFNYFYEIRAGEGESFDNAIQSIYPEQLDLGAGKEIKKYLPSFIIKESDSILQIKFDGQATNPSLDAEYKEMVSINHHYAGSSFPDNSVKLRKKYTENELQDKQFILNNLLS